jgi:hypothetical protein
MERYDATRGDRIELAWSAGRIAPDDLVLAVDAASAPTSGVLTTAHGADALHRLFRDGTTFDLRVVPAGGDAVTVFEGCTLVSSSGKWVESGAGAVSDPE